MHPLEILTFVSNVGKPTIAEPYLSVVKKVHWRRQPGETKRVQPGEKKEAGVGLYVQPFDRAEQDGPLHEGCQSTGGGGQATP